MLHDGNKPSQVAEKARHACALSATYAYARTVETHRARVGRGHARQSWTTTTVPVPTMP